MSSLAPRPRKIAALATVAGFLVLPAGASAQGFSRTEAQYQGGWAWVEGSLSAPGFQNILTLQHASAWSAGSNFFFVDMVCCEGPASNRDMYLEWYSSLRLGAIRGEDLSLGPVRSVNLLGGVNWGAQARVAKFTPGIRLALDLPGFAFANLDFTYLVDFGAGLEGGGAPKADGIFGVDFNWARPFQIGESSFSVEGHGEWQSPAGTETGERQPHQVLLQPQIRYDLGKALWGPENRVLVGTELHLWINKFAVEGVNEFLPQLLVVFGF